MKEFPTFLVTLGSDLPDLRGAGTPQGTVLSPLLFTSKPQIFSTALGPTCHLKESSDDSAVVGCIIDGQEGEYRAAVDDFVDRSGCF